MKRLPLLVNILLFVFLCAVIAFWGMRFFAPKPRPQIAPVSSVTYEPGVGQWGTLFGQAPVVEAGPSAYLVKGVIVAPKASDSSAIVFVEGKPTFILGIGKELSPGVVLREVHSDHIIVAESGMPRRIDVPPQPPVAAGLNPVAPNAPQTILKNNVPVPPPPIMAQPAG